MPGKYLNDFFIIPINLDFIVQIIINTWLKYFYKLGYNLLIFMNNFKITSALKILMLIMAECFIATFQQLIKSNAYT